MHGHMKPALRVALLPKCIEHKANAGQAFWTDSNRLRLFLSNITWCWFNCLPVDVCSMLGTSPEYFYCGHNITRVVFVEITR
jgi:hypothetical protein